MKDFNEKMYLNWNSKVQKLKRLLSFCAIALILPSCLTKTEDGTNSQVMVDTTVSSKRKLEKNLITINTSLPFGCQGLTTRRWEADPENYGGLKKTPGKEFEDFGKCYASINNSPSLSFKLDRIEINHIKIGVDFKDLAYFDTLCQQSIDSLKFRLPDIGKYQCYYFFNQSEKMYGYFGNLLLLDPTRRMGKTLNIYYEVAGDQHVSFRYFLLEGETIKLYEGSCYDDGCSLSEKFTVGIKSNGNIIISEKN